LKPEVESSVSTLKFQALSFMRFQRWIDGVNLHCPAVNWKTRPSAALSDMSCPPHTSIRRL
jgi:hypothetical protein